jgi:hypothetical protein
MTTTPTQLRAEAKLLIGAEAYNEIANLNRIELSKVLARAHARFNDKLARAAGKLWAALDLEWRKA